MLDASTWVLVSLAPATAGASALWINRSRLRHERQLARFDALRKLFAEAGELLTAALSDPETVEPPQTLARQYPEFRQALAGVRLQMFRSRLLLWFEPPLECWRPDRLRGLGDDNQGQEVSGRGS
jgi:hypothetical protein